jgi:hypothetical protein
MYLFRRISEEKNLTKGTRGRVDIYQSVHADLNYLIGCAKSNVHSLDDNLPNWHVHVKEPNQKYHPGCVFCSEGLTTFYSGFGTIEDDKYECKTKVFIYNVDYIPNNMVKEFEKLDVSFLPYYEHGKSPDELYAETN